MKSLKLIKIMPMEIQGSNVSRLLFLLILYTLPIQLHSQDVKKGKLIADQIISPITKEIRTSIRKSDHNGIVNCNSSFFSIKFIINAKSFVCDTVIYSKSVYKELIVPTNLLIQQKNIDWQTILGEFNCDSIKEKYELVLPIHLTRGKCPTQKLSEVFWWTTFNELIMIQNKNLYEVIILSPVSLSVIEY